MVEVPRPGKVNPTIAEKLQVNHSVVASWCQICVDAVNIERWRMWSESVFLLLENHTISHVLVWQIFGDKYWPYRYVPPHWKGVIPEHLQPEIGYGDLVWINGYLYLVCLAWGGKSKFREDLPPLTLHSKWKALGKIFHKRKELVGKTSKWKVWGLELDRDQDHQGF